MTTPIDLTQFNGCTPGPWHVQSHGNRPQGVRSQFSNTAICSFHWKNYDASNATVKNNAKLIASAPALVAEVKALRELLAEALWNRSDATIDKARALLPS